MKGIVFNLLEQVVVREHGEDTWDSLVDAAGVSGVYTSLGSYDDAELVALVGAASEALDLPADDVIRWFGRTTMPLFVERYGALFEAHDTTRSFALALNNVIHPEVRKLYPGADTPHFEYDTRNPEKLVIEYRSARQLCAFAEGLLLGAGDHYGETLTIEQPSCMLRGDDHCSLVISAS